MRGAWQLKSLKGPTELYTNVCADIYVDTETNKEYTRGERKLFECSANTEQLPELVEATGRFKFLLREPETLWTGSDSLREIMVQSFFKN